MILSHFRKLGSIIIKSHECFLSIQSFGIAMSQNLIKAIENGGFGEVENSKSPPSILHSSFFILH